MNNFLILRKSNMKNIFTTLILFFGIISFAQTAIPFTGKEILISKMEPAARELPPII
ncbi:hypothetical protein [Chryseobacterium piscium]|uniref:hypothetical protein n=1 Tax=Chryseobacterium piscium TaxID=333702 RepID=UPI001F4DC9E1|nr:hypothetical protein [Chryseobacterium piscium]